MQWAEPFIKGVPPTLLTARINIAECYILNKRYFLLLPILKKISNQTFRYEIYIKR